MPKRRISKELLRSLSWLCRIKLTRGEEELILPQLNKILDYFAKMDEVNTRDVPPTHHVLDLVNVFREDKPVKWDADALLKNVPRTKDRYVRAPRMA